MNQPQALLTVSQVQSMFTPKLSKSMIYRLIETGEISVVRPRNKYFIRAETVDKLLNSEVQ